MALPHSLLDSWPLELEENEPVLAVGQPVWGPSLRQAPGHWCFVWLLLGSLRGREHRGRVISRQGRVFQEDQGSICRDPVNALTSPEGGRRGGQPQRTGRLCDQDLTHGSTGHGWTAGKSFHLPLSPSLPPELQGQWLLLSSHP